MKRILFLLKRKIGVDLLLLPHPQGGFTPVDAPPSDPPLSLTGTPSPLPLPLHEKELIPLLPSISHQREYIPPPSHRQESEKKGRKKKGKRGVDIEKLLTLLEALEGQEDQTTNEKEKEKGERKL